MYRPRGLGVHVSCSTGWPFPHPGRLSSENSVNTGLQNDVSFPVGALVFSFLFSSSLSPVPLLPFPMRSANVLTDYSPSLWDLLIESESIELQGGLCIVVVRPSPQVGVTSPHL